MISITWNPSKSLIRASPAKKSQSNVLFVIVTCWMRLMRLSSVSAMYSVPRWDSAMALAASRVARTAAHLTRWWSIPGTWQWMGRPATIRTWRLSDTWNGKNKHTPSCINYVKETESKYLLPVIILWPKDLCLCSALKITEREPAKSNSTH